MKRRHALYCVGCGVAASSVAPALTNASAICLRCVGAKTQSPLIALSEHPSRPSPARRPVLRFMGWSDGLLYDNNAPVGATAQPRLRMADGQWLERVRKALLDVEDLSQHTYRVPDHSYFMLTATDQSHARCQLEWDEVIRPRWGANPQATPSYHAFVHVWFAIRVALAAGVFEELDATDASQVRELSELDHDGSFSQWLARAFPE